MFSQFESEKVNELIKKFTNSRNKYPHKNVSKSSSISNDFLRKSIKKVINYFKIKKEEKFRRSINLGDEFGNLFTTRVVKLERKLLTPTSQEKNFEIKRMVFNQKREIKPELTPEYLQSLYKLLNTKDKNFIM